MMSAREGFALGIVCTVIVEALVILAVAFFVMPFEAEAPRVTPQ